MRETGRGRDERSGDDGSSDEGDDSEVPEHDEGSVEPLQPGFFIVSGIVDHAAGAIAGTAKYLCTWQGWPESDKTWEKEEELPVDLVNAYKARIREQYQAGV